MGLLWTSMQHTIILMSKKSFEGAEKENVLSCSYKKPNPKVSLLAKETSQLLKRKEGHNKKKPLLLSKCQNLNSKREKKNSALTLPGERLAAETGTGRVGNRQISLERRAGVSSCMAEEQPGKQVGEGEHRRLYNLVWWTGVSSTCWLYWGLADRLRVVAPPRENRETSGGRISNHESRWKKVFELCTVL